MSLTKEDIQGCIRGEQRSQTKFCKHVFNTIIYRVKQVAKTPEDAIEWTNSITLHLMNKLHYFRGYEEDTGNLMVGRLYRWVNVVAFKMCTGNFIRVKNYNVKLLPEDFMYDQSSDTDADSDLMYDTLSETIEGIITAPRQLEVFKLYADGWSNQDIADKFKIGVGTVKWHISEARAILRDHLSKLGYDRKYYKGGSSESANNYRAAREPMKKKNKKLCKENI